MPKICYCIEAPGKNRDYLVKSKDKDGIYRCCELMNELEPGLLGVPKFVVTTYEENEVNLNE